MATPLNGEFVAGPVPGNVSLGTYDANYPDLLISSPYADAYLAMAKDLAPGPNVAGAILIGTGGAVCVLGTTASDISLVTPAGNSVVTVQRVSAWGSRLACPVQFVKGA